LAIFVPDLLAGKVAIVTGGGTGIGKEVGRQLALHGADVVVASRNPEHIEPAAEEIRSLGRKSLAVQTNIRELEQVQNLFKRAVEEFGKVDILVNNAGGQFLSLVENMSVRGWQAVVDLNLNGTFYCCKTASEYMIPARSGNIINIVHFLSLDRGGVEIAHSGAARAGVVNMTKALAVEWARYNIRVNALAPGTIDTAGFLAEMTTRQETTSAEDYAVRERNMIPMKRLGTTLEVANAVLYLASPASSFVTGIALVVDGGEYQSNWPSMWGMYGDPPMEKANVEES
jgi:NAD(P)-dependent dehydrogenase (short-subunit alcohol dehydrogenase family)